jgi:hypothetical protein
MIKKNLRLITIIWIMLIIFSSCEKDKDFPNKYVFDSFYSGDLKAYTKTGEITDEIKINNFIEGQDDIFWQSSYQSNDWHVEIEIISESKARIYDSDTSIYYDLIHKNGIIYFQFLDTMISYGVLTNERLKYSPLYIQSFPAMSGAPIIYIPCYYIIKSSGELHVPFVSYVEKIYGNDGGFISSQGIGNYNNVFNTTYLTKVQNSGNLIDTIIYQDNKVIFKEK